MPPGTGVAGQSYRRSPQNSTSSFSRASRLSYFECPPLLSIGIPSHLFRSERRARVDRAPSFGTSRRGDTHKTQAFVYASAPGRGLVDTHGAQQEETSTSRGSKSIHNGEPASGRGVVLRMCKARRWALKTV